MKLVTADQMRALEQQADRSGNSFATMMERAGKGVADALMASLADRETRENRVLVLVGPGNNGGDGLVCARALFDAGAPVSIYAWKRAANPSDANYRLCVERDISIVHAEQDAGFAKLRDWVAQHEVIVDALLGTGVTRPIEGLLKELLGVVKDELAKPAHHDWVGLVPSLLAERPPSPFVVAVDLPSGLNPDTGAVDPATLPADLTVTFALPKVGQLLYPGADAVGELVVVDIGIPAEWARDVRVQVATAAEVAASLPAHPQNSHKGTYGKAMLCAGSINYVGAAYLAGSAATRVGAGLVTLALARSIQPIIAAAAHEATYLPLPDDDGALVADAVQVLIGAAADYDSILFGPGFGRHPKTIDFVHGLVTNARMQLQSRPHFVIDADALFALSLMPDWWTILGPGQAILTPHPGEMATLAGLSTEQVQKDRIETARSYAAKWNQFLVLKGAHTVVANPDGQVTLIPFATAALATAGTGDVLAGTIAGLLAQKMEAYDAAVAGAYVHGLAGVIAEEEIGNAGTAAGDLLPRLPEAIRHLHELA